MACVIVSDRTQDLILTSNFARKIDRTNMDGGYQYKRRIIMKYMNNDIPSIISHLTASIRNNFSEERKPQLRCLKIFYPNITCERLSNSKDNRLNGDQELIFRSIAQTQGYEKYPEILSSVAHKKNYATKAYSENIPLQLCDLFSFGRNSFEKLKEIHFSTELDFFSTTYDRSGNPVHKELFANIGKSCPNLQKLDLRNGFFVPNSVFIHLIFRDVEYSLNKNKTLRIFNLCQAEAVGYGLNLETFVCPDLLYDRMEKIEEVNISNVIKISDLVNCVPTPSNYEGRKRELNNLCDSLRVLYIGSRRSKMTNHDIMVPFLLKTFPKLVSLDGAENIALGFQQLNDFTIDNLKIEPTHLQKLCYSATNHSREGHWKKRLRREINFFHDWIYDTGDEDIITEAADILRNIEEKEEVGSYQHLVHFVSTVSEMCPKANDILFFLPKRHEKNLHAVWRPLKELSHLERISVHGSNFEDVSYLIREVPNIDCFEINFETEEEEYSPSCVDEVLTLCSKIKLFDWHERTGIRSTLSSPTVGKTDLSTIQQLNMHLNISKDAFTWIWANASEILSLHVSYITLASAITSNHFFDLTESFEHQEMFYKSDIARMFESNPMKNLHNFYADICFPNIGAARFFVEMFRKQKIHSHKVRVLHIKIELVQSDLVPETLERVSMEMKNFAQYCKNLEKEQPATSVGYSFVRIGGVKNYIDWNGNIHPAGDWEY